MKKLIPLFLLIASLPVLASVVVLYQRPNGQIVQVINSADTLAYLGNTNALINPMFPAEPLTNCYVTNGAIVAWTAQQLASNALVSWLAASNQVVWSVRNEKTNAVNQALLFKDGTNSNQRLMRAVILGLRQALDMVRTNPTANLGTITTNSIFLNISNNIVNDPL